MKYFAAISKGLGIISILFIIAFLILEFKIPKEFTVNEFAFLICFIIMFLGLVIGLKIEFIGGMFTITGLIAYYLSHYLITQSIPTGYVILIIFFPGILYLIVALLKRRFQ